MAKLNKGDWQVENLRFTTFLVSPINPGEIHFWENLMGKKPDEIRSQPQQLLVTEEGPFLKGRLHMEARNNRIDWKIFRNPKEPPHGLPTLGSYADLEDEFRKLMLSWIKNCPDHSKNCIWLRITASCRKSFRRIQ